MNLNSWDTCLEILHGKLKYDIEFTFINEPGVIVKSDKHLVSCLSPTFYSSVMDCTETNSILVKDVTSRIFRIILKYGNLFDFELHTNLNHQDKIDILYAANNYRLWMVEEKIIKSINESINIDNSCFYLQHGDTYSKIDTEKCLEVLAANFNSLATKPSFLSLKYEQAVKLFSREDIVSKEVLILRMALEWLEGWYKNKECKNNDPNLSNQQSLHAFLFKIICFPLLKSLELKSHLVTPKYLTPREALDFMDHYDQMLKMTNQTKSQSTRRINELYIPYAIAKNGYDSDILQVATCIRIACEDDIKLKGIIIPLSIYNIETITIFATINFKTVLTQTTKASKAEIVETGRKIIFDQKLPVCANADLVLTVLLPTTSRSTWRYLPFTNYRSTKINIFPFSEIAFVIGLVI